MKSLYSPFWQSAWAVFRKDLRAELRSRELVSAMGLFALLAILVFSFALELTTALFGVNESLRQLNLILEAAGDDAIAPLDPLRLTDIVAGVYWVTILFAVMLGLNRSLAGERDQGNMDAMLIAPVSRSSIFVGKLLANALFALVIGVLLMPIMTVLFNVVLLDLRLLGVLALGVIGVTSVGTLLATMAVQTRSRETLLPIILLPICLPVLLAVVRASSGILNRQPDEFWIGWVSLLAMVDVIFVTLSTLVFPYVVEE